MSSTLSPAPVDAQLLMLRLARDIATGMQELEQILENHKVTDAQFEKIRRSPAFAMLLHSECSAWNSASNTAERTKLKASAIIEEYLVEAHSRMHDPKETLNSKVELAKLVARIGGLGNESRGSGSSDEGQKFSLTINIGDGKEHMMNFSTGRSAPIIDHDE